MADVYKIAVAFGIGGTVGGDLTRLMTDFRALDLKIEGTQAKLNSLHVGREAFASVSSFMKSVGAIAETGLGVSNMLKRDFQSVFTAIKVETGIAATAIKVDMASAFLATRRDAQGVNAAIESWGKTAGRVKGEIAGALRQDRVRAPGSGSLRHGAGHGQHPLLGMAAMGGLPTGGHHLAPHLMREAGTLREEQVHFKIAGRGEQLGAAMKEAERVQKLVPSTTIAENLRTISEMAMVFGSVEESIHHLEKMAKVSLVTKGHKGSEGAAFDLAKALELQGAKTTTVEGRAEFDALIEGFVKANLATGGKVDAKQFLNAIKYTRGMGRNLSPEFLTEVMPTIMQEMGGMQTGTVMKGFQRAIVGGRMTAEAAKKFDALGLVNPDGLKLDNDGKTVGIKAGGMKGSAVADKDPFEWVKQFLAPALQKAGLDSPEKSQPALMELFSKETAFQFASILLKDAARLEKDKLQHRAPFGLESAAKELQTEDLKTNTKGLTSSVNSFLEVIGNSALVDPAIAGMKSLAAVTRNLTGAFTGGGSDESTGGPSAGTGLALMGGAGALGAWALKSRMVRGALSGGAMGYMMGGAVGGIAGAGAGAFGFSPFGTGGAAAGGGPAAAAATAGAAEPVVAAIAGGVLSGVIGGISAWGGALSVASTGIAKRAAETTKPFQDAGSDFALGVEIMRQTTQKATPEINNSVKAYQSTETSAPMLSGDGGTSGSGAGKLPTGSGEFGAFQNQLKQLNDNNPLRSVQLGAAVPRGDGSAGMVPQVTGTVKAYQSTEAGVREAAKVSSAQEGLKKLQDAVEPLTPAFGGMYSPINLTTEAARGAAPAFRDLANPIGLTSTLANGAASALLKLAIGIRALIEATGEGGASGSGAGGLIHKASFGGSGGSGAIGVSPGGRFGGLKLGGGSGEGSGGAAASIGGSVQSQGGLKLGGGSGAGGGETSGLGKGRTASLPPTGLGSGGGSSSASGSAAGAVDLAMGHLGERSGDANLRSFVKSGSGLDPRVLAWCAAFVNSSLKKQGLDGSHSAVATSFLRWGNRVNDLSKVTKGDVLVQARGRAAGQPGGHVGFATGRTRGFGNNLRVEMLAGNTSHAVKKYWERAGRLEGRRAPNVVPPPPPPQRETIVNTHLHVDGRKMAANTTRHQAAMANGPAQGGNFADGSALYPQAA